MGRWSDFVDGVMLLHDRLTKRSLASFNRIDCRDGVAPHALVSKEGGMVTVLRIHGCRNITGVEEIGKIVEDMSEGLSPSMKTIGHKIQLWFSRDPDRSSELIARAVYPAEVAAQQQGLDVDDILREQKTHLSGWTSWEECLVSIWTMPSAISAVDNKRMAAELAQINSAAPPASDVQWPWRIGEILRARHNAFVAAVEQSLSFCEIMVEVLSPHEVLQVIREAIYPQHFNDGWKPVLNGDRIRRRDPVGSGTEEDVSHILALPIDRQIFDMDAKRLNQRIVSIGDKVWSFRDLILAPENVKPFSYLMAGLIDADPRMPWRFSMLLEGEGLRGTGLAKQLASLLTWLGPFGGMPNKQLRDALDAQYTFIEEGGCAVRMRMSFATWTDKNELPLLQTRAETLGRIVTMWGGCQVNDLVGDPLEGVMSSAPVLHSESTAPVAHPPIADAILMAPLGRPASPWKDGSVLLRSLDGKLFPFQPGSDKQDTWLDLVFSPPGGGKSVLMNIFNLGCVLTPQMGRESRLPLIGIIDIGFSSRGFIDLLRDALPRGRRDEALYVKLRNHLSDAINPFDIQLGLRKPLPYERAFLVNFLCLLCTPIGVGKEIYDAMPDLISRCIDIVYELRSDDVSPRRYARGEDAVVDAVIDEIDLLVHLPQNPTWYEVVDALFDRHYPNEAALAQRYAVPLMSDLTEAAHTMRVQEEFAEVRVSGTNETLIGAFSRFLQTAQTDYPLLAYPTRFHLADARVVSLDLADVAPKGSPAADHQTAVMYMLARHIVARDFFLDPKDMPSLFPPRYQRWQKKRMEDLKLTPRRLVYDEFHRTHGAGARLRAQVVDDARTGRKSGLQMCIGSQMPDDFGKELVSMATGVWILKVGQESSAEEIADRFGLTRSQKHLLRKLRGPQARGTRMLAILDLHEGTFHQDVVLTVGPTVLWSFSSTFEDDTIRSHVCQAIGSKDARRVLAKRFPGGSALKEIQRRKEALSASDLMPDDAIDNIMESIVKELIHMGR